MTEEETRMATILLTDDEYTHIQGLMTDLLSKVQQASPRAATHYATVAKMHADFLAREDGKRATSRTKVGARESLLKAKEARRNGGGTQTPVQTPQGSTPA
jgi:hypothetical protein